MQSPPDRRQQALAALAVLLVVMTTVAAGILLAVSDNPTSIALQDVSPTRVRIPTVGPSPTEAQVPTATATQLTPPASATPSATLTPSPTDTAIPPADTHAPPMHIPPSPTRTPKPTATRGLPVVSPGVGPTQTTTTTDGACTFATSTIASPLPGDVVNGTIPIIGSADFEDFSYYKLEIRPYGTGSDDYVTVVTETSPVVNGVLFELNTEAFPNRDYWLRLAVVDSTGNYPERCAIRITIRN